MGKIIGEGITFDDVLLVPAYSEVTPNMIDLTTYLTKKIKLNIPMMSAGMDTVTEHRMGLDKVVSIIPGGATAQDSIYNVLKDAEKENDGDSIVLLHDGVRPFVSYDTIKQNIESVQKYGSAITCTACYETILLSKSGEKVDSVPYRKDTFAAQAPQSFRLKDIIAAHDEVRAINPSYENMVDACTIMTTLGKEVHMISGNRGNIKVTTPEDVYMFRALLNYKENEQTFGIGLTNGIR